jgi:hypothetical protein
MPPTSTIEGPTRGRLAYDDFVRLVGPQVVHLTTRESVLAG